MEAKSKKQLRAPKGFKNPLIFISELKEELKKVSWTTKTELISATKTVIISVFFFGFSIYVMDLGIKGLLEVFKRSILFIFG